MNRLFSEGDWRHLEEGETYEHQFVIIKPEFFRPAFRDAKFQLFYACGGFGCDPTKIGNAVFGRDCEEEYRQERYNILGVATEDAIQTWEKEYGLSREVLRKAAKE